VDESERAAGDRIEPTAGWLVGVLARASMKLPLEISTRRSRRSGLTRQPPRIAAVTGEVSAPLLVPQGSTDGCGAGGFSQCPAKGPPHGSAGKSEAPDACAYLVLERSRHPDAVLPFEFIAPADEDRDRSVDVTGRFRQAHWPQQVLEQLREVLGDQVLPPC
jgi:hypothetical protein